MNTYTFSVKLEVEVDAFDESDALEVIEETFGEGEDGSVTVSKLTIGKNVIRKSVSRQ